MISDELIQTTLDTTFEHRFLGEMTVREYFKRLLWTLWQEGEGFSAKRPFGDSNWYYDIGPALVMNGLIEDEYDENYDTVVGMLIDAL